MADGRNPTDQAARTGAFDRGMATLNELLAAGAQNVREHAASHPGFLRVEVADDLHVVAVEALKAGQFDYASLASSVGGSLDMALGRMEQAMEDREIFLQVNYQRASTPEEYEAVRADLLDLAERASASGDAHRVLSSRALAIQAGYFGAEATSDPRESERWIRQTLGDLLELLETSPAPMPPTDVALVMDFAFAPLDLATSRAWIEQRSVDALLRDLGEAIDRHVPPDAPLSTDPERDAAIALVLARLPERG